jgi:hypothetical protein
MSFKIGQLEVLVKFMVDKLNVEIQNDTKLDFIEGG